MSLEIEQIKGAAAKFASRYGPSTIVTATVLAVNDNNTVRVQYPEGGIVDDCRLKAVLTAGNEIVMVPAVGSVVLVGMIGHSDECAVLSVSQITEIKATTGGTKYSITQDGFLFQKGSDDLRQVIELLIEAVQQIVVIQGTNPDYGKLLQAQTKVKNVLRNA